MNRKASGGGSTGLIDTANYLTINAENDGLTASLSVNAVEYCIDGSGDWVKLPAGTATPAIKTGQTLSFRGKLTPASGVGVGTFTISTYCSLSGNCMSLLFGDDAPNQLSLSGYNYAFCALFANNKYIDNAASLKLPATTLSSYCYYCMFKGCDVLHYAPTNLPATSMKTACYAQMFYGCGLYDAPYLSATTLAAYCYDSMFYGCTNLTDQPQTPLPAKTLKTGCYNRMYYGCTGVPKAPVLPAETLVTDCYKEMFYGCSRLSYIEAMFTTAPGPDYTENWVSGVASRGTFVRANASTWDENGVNGVPSGWTQEGV